MREMYDWNLPAADDNKHGFTFSDDENEYNYYTNSDEEDFERFAEQQFSRLRALGALLLPTFVSIGIGCFLAKQQSKKNQCEAAAPKLKANELGNRMEAIQYPGNDPIEDRLCCH